MPITSWISEPITAISDIIQSNRRVQVGKEYLQCFAKSLPVNTDNRHAYIWKK